MVEQGTAELQHCPDQCGLYTAMAALNQCRSEAQEEEREQYHNLEGHLVMGGVDLHRMLFYSLLGYQNSIGAVLSRM
jgi:hypothetical protein